MHVNISPISINSENRSDSVLSTHTRTVDRVGCYRRWTMNSAVRSSTLCAAIVQVGSDTETVKEPVTRWHQAAGSRLCSKRLTIVVLIRTLSRQRHLFCGSWHRCTACLVLPGFSAMQWQWELLFSFCPRLHSFSLLLHLYVSQGFSPTS